VSCFSSQQQQNYSSILVRVAYIPGLQSQETALHTGKQLENKAGKGFPDPFPALSYLHQKPHDQGAQCCSRPHAFTETPQLLVDICWQQSRCSRSSADSIHRLMAADLKSNGQVLLLYLSKLLLSSNGFPRSRACPTLDRVNRQTSSLHEVHAGRIAWLLMAIRSQYSHCADRA
jgi:hypothetical protein